MNRADADSQIRAMGAWISKVWDSALEFAENPLLNNFTVPEIAYGLWHKGAYTKKASAIKDGIEEVLTNPTNDYYFHHTYIEALNGLEVKEILYGSNKKKLFPSGTRGLSGQTGGTTEETLRRLGDEVWRIKPDGSTRGYFISP